jgi:pyruvate ferredoxin oxidoreductase beta subunit
MPAPYWGSEEDYEMASTIDLYPIGKLEPFKGVKKIPLDEFFTSGHRTCQGCESALVMKMMAKAAGPRTIVLGSTGCMYVANTTYNSTSWVIPWMHTQLGASGAAALGTAAGLKAQMRKGKMKKEPINVIAFCGDGGGADMGLSGISATLTHPNYNCLILMYDNESYANTDIQLSGSTPYGANTTFSPPGKVRRIMHHRWKKNMAGMMAAGHPECKYVATVCMSYGLAAMNSVRKALTIGGPTFIHSLDPCPKGWDYDPILSHELGELAVTTGIWPLYEIENHVLKLTGKTKEIAEGRTRRLPVGDYLLKQGRFAHFEKEDIDYFQNKIDEMWEKWLIPGVIPFRTEVEADKPPA